MHAERDESVTVALIVRPHGVRGEVAAEILTDFPERLTKLQRATLWNPTAAPRSAEIRRCWLSHSRGGQAIFQFASSNSVDDAKKLVGFEVRIPLAERAILPDGSYYISDLVGCELVETGGMKVGVVRDVEINGDSVQGTPLLVVDLDAARATATSRQILVPLAQDICVRVDLAARGIEVKLPDGLLELNQR
jgi:16S rRNA processing protein RimM